MINMNGHKKPRQYNDEIHCEYCGKSWDIKELNPPACNSGHDKFIEMKDRLKQLKGNSYGS